MPKFAAIVFSSVLGLVPALLPYHAAQAQSAAVDQVGKTRVVLQVSQDDPKKWGLALNNTKNIQKDLGEKNVAIEIVAYGMNGEMLRRENGYPLRLVVPGVQGVSWVSGCARISRSHRASSIRRA